MNPDTLSASAWALLLTAAFIQGVAKAGVPGLAILAIPLVAQAIPGRASTGLILPMLILGDLFAVGYWRRAANWRDLRRALPWALAGIVAGYLLLNHIRDEWMRPLIGAIILAILLLHLLQNSLAPLLAKLGTTATAEAPDATADSATAPKTKAKARLFAAFMGTTGGITTMLANAAGPVMSLYFLALRLPKATFLGTSAWFFLIVNWTKVPFMAHRGMITIPSLKLNLLMAPALILGAILGIHVAKRLPEKAFARIVLLLTAASALKLLLLP
ncbi:MAG: sulfite exporter TauE/SafE family protein [Lentisphaeria bacterium]|jgi:hypothetical protein